MKLNIEELLQIIGQKEAELFALRRERAELVQTVERERTARERREANGDEA